MLLHERLTRRRLRRTAALAPHLPSPLPTERRVEQDPHALEMPIDIAFPRKGRNGRTPGTRIRLPAADISRNIPPRERPDLDPLARHLRDHDRTTLRIERRAIALRPRVLDLAPRVLALRGVADVAVCRLQRAGEARLLDPAACVGVQRHAVVGRVIDALEDVDLAVLRPGAGAKHPEGGPDAADAAGHVCDVGDDEAFVVGFFAGEPDGGAAVGRGFGRRVDADVDGVGGLGGGAD